MGTDTCAIHNNCSLTPPVPIRSGQSVGTHTRACRTGILALGATLATATLAAAPAAAPAGLGDPAAKPVDTIVVIGRLQNPAETRLAGSFDVIGRDELQYEHVDDTLELLSKVPGAYLARYNQGIINTDVAIRGFAGDGVTPHAKLLIDGIPSNLHNGYGELDQLFPMGIESIQLFKGTADPRFGLYNIAGNYNVFSRSDTDTASLEATVGNFATRELQGYLGVDSGKLQHSYFAGWREAEGYRDSMDLNKFALSGRWFYDLDERSRLGLIARFSGYEGGSLQNRFDDQDQIGLISRLHWTISDSWALNAGFDYEDQQVIKQRFGTLGQSRRRDRANVIRNFDYELSTLGAYLQVEHELNRYLRWNLALRLDWLDGDFAAIGAAGERNRRDIFDFGTIVQPKLNVFLATTDTVTLFDEFYEYAFDFGQAGVDSIHSPGDGRNFTLSVRYDF